MMAYKHGAIFDSDDSVIIWPKTVFLVFTNEFMNGILGGTIYVRGVDSNFVTIVENTVFYDNIGPSGASIGLDGFPGVLIAKDCIFKFFFSFTVPE